MISTDIIDTIDANSKRASRTRRAQAASARPDATVPSKMDMVLKKLGTAKGVTLAQLTEATGWQAHSVRGFLSGTVKKKLGLNLVSDVSKDSVRRYRVVADAIDGASDARTIQHRRLQHRKLAA